MTLEPLRKASADPITTTAHEPQSIEPTTLVGQPELAADRVFGGSTFAKPAAGPRDPDEGPVSWTNQRSAPPHPFELFNCTAEGDAPARIPQPAQPKRASVPSAPVHHTSHHRPDNPLRSEAELPDFSDARREKYWNAFKATSAEAQARHATMGTNLDAFRHAEGDPTLEPLGYRTKSRSHEVNLPALTDQQKVPQQSGVTVGSLFDGDNRLRLDKHDQQAIDGAATAMNKGRGTIDARMQDTITSDALLKARVSEIKFAFRQIDRAAALLRSAASAITAHQASEETKELQAEIDSLKAEANDAQEVVDLVLGVVTTVVYGATGEFGDAINQLGVVAGRMLGHVNDNRIAKALSKLQDAQQQQKAATTASLGERLRAERSGLLGANEKLVQAGHDLDAVLSARRAAYNDLALAAGEEIPCPERSRHKIAGMLAAIPLVEIVISRAQVLGSTSAPEYNELTGRGLGMAAYHGLPVANAFLRACGELNFNRMTARLAEGEWSERLNALLDVKTRIGGLRPG